MKSEVKADGSKPDSTDPVDSSPGNVPVPADAEDSGMDDATPDGMGEKSRRKEETSPTSPETSPRSPVTSPDFSSGEKGEEKPEPSGGSGIITYAALLLLAVGAGWFLFGLVRRRRADAVDSGYEEVEQYNRRIPAFPGF